MSEPLTSLEIEDVLSSIRRLVSEDLRPVRAAKAAAVQMPAAEPADEPRKLLLTPALRVVPAAPMATDQTDTADEAVSWAMDADGFFVTGNDDAMVHGAVLSVTEAGYDGSDENGTDVTGAGLAGPVAVMATLRATEEEALPPPVGAGAATGDLAGPDLLPEPQALLVPEAVEVTAFDAAEEPQVQAKAAIGDEVLTMPEVVPEAEQTAWAVMQNATDTWAEEETLWAEPEAVPFVAHPRRTEAVDPIARELADRAEAAVIAELEQEMVAAVAPASETVHPRPSVAPIALDEQMLREMVRDIIREELASTLGERITRNVRKLVRVEINRAMAAVDLG